MAQVTGLQPSFHRGPPGLPALAALAFAVGCSGALSPPDPVGMVKITVDGAPSLSGSSGTFYMDRYEFPNQEGEKPLTYLDLEQAASLCAQEGKRLCTAGEWRRACLGPDGTNRYGYGPVYQEDRCHSARRLPSGHTSMMDPDELVAPSGSFPQCSTPEGIWDLVGNLEEWVLDDWKGMGGILEGGAWYTHTSYADCTGRYSRQPDYRIDPRRRVFSAGFRCCWSAEAPSAEDLPPEYIAADTRERLQAAQEAVTPTDYDPQAELQLADGLWMDTFEYPNKPGINPLIAVSWTQARDLCQEAGKRLCQVREWEIACSGPARWKYPYGNRYIPDACSVERDSPSPTGEYLACVSPLGARDMVGGVWEWTANRLDIPGLTSDPQQVLREIRGGSWFVDSHKAVCRPDDGYPAAPQDTVFPDLGFRCCRGQVQSTAAQPIPPNIDCPAGMVAVGDFCIDTFEFPNREGAPPRGNMNLAQALQACRERGVHVCTSQEWELACSGREHRRWPYGNTYEPDRCYDESRSRQSHGGTAAASGQMPLCATPEGVHDMCGNLWEWVMDTDTRGSLRGGGWNVAAGLGQCRARADAEDDYSSAETGTRCCAVAQEIEAAGP